MDKLEVLLGVGAFLLVFGLLIIVAAYILLALAIRRVLVIYEYPNTWMAWIPFLNFFALSDAVCEGRDTLQVFNQDVPSIVFKFWWVLQIIVGFIPVVGNLCRIAVAVILFGTVLSECYARIEKRPVEATRAIGFVSGWLSIIAVIKFLTYDKNMRLDKQNI